MKAQSIKKKKRLDDRKQPCAICPPWTSFTAALSKVAKRNTHQLVLGSQRAH